MSGKVKVWGNVGTVEWADPIEDPDPEVMAKVMAVKLIIFGGGSWQKEALVREVKNL